MEDFNQNYSAAILGDKEKIFNDIVLIMEQKTGMKIDPKANFLELGGNSIAAALIIGEINQKFTIEINAGKLVDTSSIAEFIEYATHKILSKGNNASYGSIIQNTKPMMQDNKKWPISSDQERIFFLDRLYPGTPIFNIYSAMRIKGKFKIDLLNVSYNFLLNRHELLRAYFVIENNKMFQMIKDAEPVIVPIEEIKESEIEIKVKTEAKKGMNLFEGDLIKIKIFRINENDQILFVNIHHIISDFWSIEIILSDLIKTYFKLCGKQGMELVPLKSNFLEYINYHNALMGKTEKQLVEYWIETLKNVPTTISLPYDFDRPKTLTYQAEEIVFDLNKETVQAIIKLTMELKVTIFNFLYSAFASLLYIISRQNEFLIGCAMANRKLPDFQKIIGNFANALVLKNQFFPDQNIVNLMKVNLDISNNAFNHSDIPFFNLVQNLTNKNEFNMNPLFQVMFNLIQIREYPVVDDISVEDLYLFSGYSDYDIFLSMGVNNQRIVGAFDYSKELFLDSTAQAIISGYVSIIEQIVKKPDIKIKELVIPDDLQKKVDDYSIKNYKQRIIISSTFSDQPVKEILSFWMNKLKMPSSIELADYNQVFNQLLDPSQLMMMNKDGINVLLIRLEDWIRYSTDDRNNSDIKEKIFSICDDFIKSLQKAANSFTVPVILSILPSRNEANLIAEEDVEILKEKIIKGIMPLSNIYLLKDEEVLTPFPITHIFDELTDKEGHLPYTVDFYKTLGTAISRKIYAIKRKPFKVIVLDCDNTLWKGVIGEDGIDKIEIDPERAEFQKWMAEQKGNGMVLCLVSKNEESDILKALQEKSGMILTADHITLIKANWESKSENIIKISKELNLGLDSFIFIDDNPLECAEVSGAIPEVLTLQFPQEPESIHNLIKHGWFWDHLKITEEDRARTVMYKQDILRNKEIEKHISFEEFVNSLQLKIDIEEIKNEDLLRVSQLTLRTNQFNTTTLRRTEQEISEFISNKQNKCLTVKVSDRFGSYGLVGAVFYILIGKYLKVESFILSCRTLGKGVEHRIMSGIAELAKKSNIEDIMIPYHSTSKNIPVYNFLNSIEYLKNDKVNDSEIFYYSSGKMIDLKFNPTSLNKEENLELKDKKTISSTKRHDQEILLDILNNYNSIDKINIKGPVIAEIPSSSAEPANDVQEKIVGLIKEVLNKDSIGIDDNFFDLGGHSIQLVQFLSKIQNEFDQALQITDLFQYTTIRKLAEFLTKGEVDNKLKKMKERGELQRQRIMGLRK